MPQALSKLQGTPASPYASLIDPARHSRVGGVVTLTARVEFFVTPPSSPADPWPEDIKLGDAVSVPVSGLCSLDWDTTAVDHTGLPLYPDGEYSVRAKVNGSGFGITLIVGNEIAGGLALTIKKPGGEPAAGAKVTVYHAERNADGTYRLMGERKSSPVYQGAADLRGKVILPASLAVNGNDFLVVAQGTEPNFLYHRLVRSPGTYVLDPDLDPGLARRVTVTAAKTDGNALSGALLLADLTNVAQPEDSYIETSGALFEIPLSQLSAVGTGQVWLTPGNYALRLASPEAGYLLSRQLTVSEGAQALPVSITPGDGDVARIRLSDGDPDRTGIQNGRTDSRPFAPTTSFYKSSFPAPDHLLSGAYQAFLELGAGPEGLVASLPVSFTLQNNQAAPRLNAIVPNITNQATVTVSGTAAPGAAVTVSYRLGESTEPLSPVTADENGAFSLQVTLPADGSYTFTARALINEVESDASNAVTVILDRIPPGTPAGFTATAGASTVMLRWDAPSFRMRI
ncbi:MAG: Ig-like domain-containing protein [Clostridia bacterium]|jgi:hypothetical protein|nr:Ig-like domain-containing protein [Clostridia bacterium]